MPINGARLPLAAARWWLWYCPPPVRFWRPDNRRSTAVFCGGQNRVGILGLAVVVLAGLAVGGQVVDPGIVHPGGGENGLHPGFGLLGIICGGFKLENMLLIKEVAGIHIVHHRVLRGRVPTGAFLGLVLAGGAAAVIGGRQRRLTLNQLLRVGGAALL